VQSAECRMQNGPGVVPAPTGRARRDYAVASGTVNTARSFVTSLLRMTALGQFTLTSAFVLRTMADRLALCPACGRQAGRRVREPGISCNFYGLLLVKPIASLAFSEGCLCKHEEGERP